MFVCVCNAITDREIRACAELGAATVEDLREHLGVASCCGQCQETARAVLRECAGRDRERRAA